MRDLVSIKGIHKAELSTGVCVCVCVCGQVKLKVNGKVYFLTDLVGKPYGRFKYRHFDRGLRRARDKFYASIDHISDVAISDTCLID